MALRYGCPAIFPMLFVVWGQSFQDRMASVAIRIDKGFASLNPKQVMIELIYVCWDNEMVCNS